MQHKKYLIYSIALLLFNLCAQSEAYADRTNCGFDTDNQPCSGAPGIWSINSDGSDGGFIAETANVESTSFLGYWRKNVSYMGPCVQVCDSARIKGDKVFLGDQAKISGNAIISGRAMIYEHAHIFGNAQVSGEARVFGTSQILDQVVLSGTVAVFGTAKIRGNTSLNQGIYLLDDSELIDNLCPLTGIVNQVPTTTDALPKPMQVDQPSSMPFQTEDLNSYTSEILGSEIPGPEFSGPELSWEDVFFEGEDLEKTQIETPIRITQNGISIISETPLNDLRFNDVSNTLSELSMDKKKVTILASIKRALKSKIAQLNENLKTEQAKLNIVENQLENEFDNCPVCFSPFHKAQILRLSRCNHIICQICLNKIKSNGPNGTTCPLCRAKDLDTDSLRIEYPYRDSSLDLNGTQ